MSESQQQVAVIDWWALNYPELELCLMAYPSGAIIGGKNKFALIKKLKTEGWRNGVSDLFLAIPSGDFHGLWIEMKDIKKTKCSVSKDQIDHLIRMSEQGYLAVWCAGSDAAIETIERYMEIK